MNRVLECWPGCVVFVLLRAGEEGVFALTADIVARTKVVPVDLLIGPRTERHAAVEQLSFSSFSKSLLLKIKEFYIFLVLFRVR